MGKGRRKPVKSQGDRPHGKSYNEFTTEDMQNATFTCYYQRQLGLSEEEMQQMLDSFRQPLPTTFRVTGSRKNVQGMNETIKDVFVPFLTGVTFEDQKADPPAQIPWYPGGTAWQVNVEKRLIRRSPEFKKFQNFLVYETETGNLSRQEAVSMIPPLLLDVQSHHAVLDTCAAPGSKSAQILEALHMSAEDGRPTGFFVANDSDTKRCHMLVHQSLRRISSPNMMVTNNDASILPTFKISSARDPSKLEAVQFDRILADVPCTGDGTLRKNLAIWKTWSLGNAYGLHPLQLRILLRSIQLLKPGGRLVYSTCSLNPVENEAVVNAALDACSDMSLIDVTHELPLLKRTPGISSWTVVDADQSAIERPRDAVFISSSGKKFPVSLWPSDSTSRHKLERCLRIYPHHQNTGGFFVAVLEKAGNSDSSGPESIAETSLQISKGETIEQNEEKMKDQHRTKRQKLEQNDEPSASLSQSFKEDPYTYLSADNSEVKSCLEFFKMDSSFDASNLLVRNASGTALRSIYATSPSVRRIVHSNDYRRIRLVSCGVKVFAKQDSNKSGTYACKWRVLNDGIGLLRTHVHPSKIVRGSFRAFKILLDEQYPPISAFDADVKQQLENQELGSCLFEIEPDVLEHRSYDTLVAPLWKAPNTLCLMIEKTEKLALKNRFFVDLASTSQVTIEGSKASTPPLIEPEGDQELGSLQ